MKESQQRLSRFTRDPNAAGSFQFTKRDLEVLRHVAEHRFIRSNWLIKLVGGSHQQLLRRLNLLYHHGYLERPRCQIDYYHKGGSKNIVYGLASRGAGRLRRDLNMPFNRMDWTTRNKRVGCLFLEHTLMVSVFMAALELDCRTRDNIRLIYGSDLLKPLGHEYRREPFRWTVDLPGKRRVSIVPDKVFAIETTRPDGRTERIHYFLEADQGTMPIERTANLPTQTSVYHKLRAYGVLFESKAHNSVPRTLCVITSSSQRAAAILKAASRTALVGRFHIKILKSSIDKLDQITILEALTSNVKRCYYSIAL